MKSAFVGIVGRPNVGKSTLLNAILDEKIAITTEKPQTTRNTIRGIYNDDDSQLVFLDTPGIHKPKNKLSEYMTTTAINTFGEVDAILFLVDSIPDKGPGDKYILNLLKEVDTPKILVINKIDKMSPEDYLATYQFYDESGVFEDIIGVSALNSTNVDDVIVAVKDHVSEGPQFFPTDMITDFPERFLVSEIVREKLLIYLNEEVPHGVAVEVESFDEGNAKRATNIGVVIYCEKKSHKGIIIGKNGRKLKGIGKAAREEIEALLGCKVFLSIWVKIKENWRDSDIALSNFGYKDN